MVTSRLQPDGWEPKRRKLPSGTYQSVPCPECGAEVGARCTYADGTLRPSANQHACRKRLAMRKYLADREATA